MADEILSDDESLSGDAQVLALSQQMFTRSETARRDRQFVNDENWFAYRSQQDFSHKAEFQSQEATPGFALSVEQIVGTFERSLTDSDDWLAADPVGVGRPILKASIIQKLLLHYLTRLHAPGNQAETVNSIQVIVADAAKMGIMEPVVTAKVYPVIHRRRHYRLERVDPDPERESGDFAGHHLTGKQLKPVDVETVRLAIDLIPWEDYFPDPSLASRYDIHRTRVSLDELLANPEYDETEVRALIASATERADKDSERQSRGERSIERDPYEVELFEAWGDIIDPNSGEVLHENVFWAWAGGHLIRRPTPNPFWDGTRPFVSAPLIRIPDSKEPKALADDAVPMWRATNELVNLIIDGSFRAAWGVGQVRPDLMERPEEIADGIPQGYTGVLKPNVPIGQKFYERIDEGDVPNLALEGLRLLEGYTQEATATPDTKLGQLPERSVKATEIVQAMRSSGSLFESFAARFEDTFLEPVFEKAWKLILQYVDTFIEDELVDILGATNTIRLQSMSADERFRLLHKTKFKVRGLRGLANREREFQKGVTILNLLGQNEQFAEFFFRKKDGEKFFNWLLRSTGTDPDLFNIDEQPEGEEPQAVEPEAAGLQEDAAAAAQNNLNPELPGPSGASVANVPDAAGAAGVQSEFAPNNPASLGGGSAII